MKKLFTFFVVALFGALVMAQEDTYTVIGSGVLFGSEFDETDTLNNMTFDGVATYVWKQNDIVLPAGRIEYRIVPNHDMSLALPKGGPRVFDIPYNGVYNITVKFHTDSHGIEFLTDYQAPHVPQHEDGYYLIGTFNGWKPGEGYRMQGSQATGQYAINTTLIKGNKLSVAYVEGDVPIERYPSKGYVVDVAHAGDVTVYYREVYQEEWAEFGGHIWITSHSSGTNPTDPNNPGGNNTQTIYSVAGSKALLGTTKEWDEKDVSTEMYLDSKDGLYKLVRTNVILAAGTNYEFKIVTNHDWQQPNYPNLNKVLKVTSDGKYNVTITFNAEDKEVGYVTEKVGNAVVEKKYLLVGDAAIANSQDWNNDADINLMASTDGGLTYKLAVSGAKLIGGVQYGFKIVEKGSWSEYYPNAGGPNAGFKVDADGVYTITYTYTVATSQCAVQATRTGDLPAARLEDGYYLVGSFAGVDAWTVDDLNADKRFRYLEGDEKYGVYTLTADLAEGDRFKVVAITNDVIMYWMPDGQGTDVVVTANGAGKAKNIYIYFDYTTYQYYIWVEANLYDGFYLVGTMNNWTPSKDYLLTKNPENEAEYVITATLAAGDEFKVLEILNGTWSDESYYPGGEAGNYLVDADHAGQKAIYFRPDYQGGEDWYYSCIFIKANSEEGIQEIRAAGKPAKVLRNGQILILKGDKTFHLLGGAAQ